MALVLTGCGTLCKPKESIVYQEKKVPIYIVLEPPVTSRPELEISTLSVEQKGDLGELAKANKITIIQLKQYVEILESIIEKQRELSLSPHSIILPNNLDAVNSN